MSKVKELRDITNQTVLPENENHEIIEREEIENTPFELVKQNNEWFIGWGMFKLTPTFHNKYDAKTYMREQSWHFAISLTAAMIEMHNMHITLKTEKGEN